jgi:uncharacterized protein (DUF2345 family)
VLVNFIENDIDQPLVVAALYNGRGEGGVPRTPGGKLPSPASAGEGPGVREVFSRANDQRASAQGNLAGGNSPAWHGASPLDAGHANAAALTGYKTKEFGGVRHNQLLLDDTNRRLRVHLASMQAWTALSLGHLIHQQDNYRGSFRGTGWELRTDAYGAVRSSRGVLLSSFGTRPSDPSQDNAPGIALAKQAAAQAKTFSQAAQTHETVRFATAIGSHQANASTLSDKEAPLPALAKVVGGMVDAHNLDQAFADAEQQTTKTGQNKVPHSAAPVVTVVGKAGIANIASQDQQWAAGETVSVQAGQDINVAVGEQLKLHAGQAIGVLAGAIKAGSGAAGTGLTVVAAEGPINVQAQADTMQIAAKDDVQMVSVTSQIDFAAAKSIELSVAGGAAIIIDASGVRVTCPGVITVNAATKSFVGPGSLGSNLPSLPATEPGEFDRYFKLRWAVNNVPMAHWRYRITKANRDVIEGVTDAEGNTKIDKAEWPQVSKVEYLGPEN